MSICKCGCGLKTYAPPSNHQKRGWKKGVPVDYAKGHNMKTKPEYLIEDKGFKTSCWMWNRAVYKTGRGQARLGSKCMGAHRAMWIREKGEIPQGMTVDHLCNQRLCVNPNHLQLVSQEINQARSTAHLRGESCPHCLRPF